MGVDVGGVNGSSPDVPSMFFAQPSLLPSHRFLCNLQESQELHGCLTGLWLAFSTASSGMCTSSISICTLACALELRVARVLGQHGVDVTTEVDWSASTVTTPWRCHWYGHCLPEQSLEHIGDEALLLVAVLWPELADDGRLQHQGGQCLFY